MRASILAALALVGCQPASPDDAASAAAEPVVFELEAVGPDPAAVEAYEAGLLTMPEVAMVLAGHRARVLQLELLPETVGGEFLPTTAFEALVYDYEDNVAWEVRGDLADEAAGLVVVQTERRPPPNLDELQDAVDMALAEDPELARRYALGEIEFFAAMPPLIGNGDDDRVISVGIRDLSSDDQTEIAGANLSDGEIIHFDAGAPPTAQAIGFVCNPPPTAFQSSSNRNEQGWARLILRQGGQELWSMYVRRPSSSGGNEGSGVELFNVAYRRQRILDRAHLPLLNVQYENDVCGPYRDWQWQENPFQIGQVLAQPAPGIVLTQWAKTIRELRDDSGNFNGVAAFWDPVHEEAVLLSELTAGWYRYVSEWRFGLDGTIKPRFGFDAVQNACTCRRHTHHAYWRFDWNLGSGANTVEQFDAATGWSTLTTETQAVRDDANGRHWRVSDAATGRSVLVEPSGREDPADPFGIADFWVMVDDPNEIDDRNGGPVQFPTQARIGGYVDGESTVDVDLVSWWAGHFVHEDTDPSTNQTHTVKLTITPNW